MTQTNDLFPEPPQRLSSLNFRSVLTFVGPGLIIASVTIGSGELVVASRSGAVFGYQLLWCFLLAGVFKGVQVYVAARHITLTGEHPMVSWKSLPGPPSWFPLLIALPTVMVMPLAFSAISEILGGYVRELTGISSNDTAVGPFGGFEFWNNFWATAVLTTCLALALSSSQQTLERVSAFVIGLIVLSSVISIMMCQPTSTGFLSGLFVPSVPDYQPWVEKTYEGFRGRSPWLEVALYLGAVGGGTYDYLGYVGMLRKKKWGLSGTEGAPRETLETLSDQQVTWARTWTRAALLDTVVSFTSVVLVTLLFAALGALLLHSAHKIPDDNMLLSQQESFLTQVHPQLRWLYRAGVFMAFIGTLYGAFEIYRYTVVESARALLPRWTQSGHLRAWQNGTVAFCFGGGIIMIWLPEGIAGNVLGKMTFGAVIGGATLCGLWCLAMLWTDATRLPPRLRMNRGLWAVTLIAGITMTALGVQTLVAFFSS
ncbi:MAG: Nramp family divalent metal transporter [Fuerstiella sp.]|nr:Nramp family divalent metal transporter [Fuerstiella sp.]